jgi:hypothetical protein
MKAELGLAEGLEEWSRLTHKPALTAREQEIKEREEAAVKEREEAEKKNAT